MLIFREGFLHVCFVLACHIFVAGNVLITVIRI